MLKTAAEVAAAEGDEDEQPSRAHEEPTLAVAVAVCSESVDRRNLHRWHLDRYPSPSCPQPSVDCPRFSTHQGSTSTAASSHTHMHKFKVFSE